MARAMNRLFHALKFRRPSQSYERLGDGRSIASNEGAVRESDKKRFSWIEYFIFLLLGVAMLWSWYVVTTDPAPLVQKDNSTNVNIVVKYNC